MDGSNVRDAALAAVAIRWYDENARDLPWRRTREAWCERLQHEDVPHAPMYDTSEALEDPQALHLALVDGSRGKLGTVVDRFVLLCCGYDPTTGGGVGETHIAVAAAADPTDAGPVRGFYSGLADSEMSVDLSVQLTADSVQPKAKD